MVAPRGELGEQDCAELRERLLRATAPGRRLLVVDLLDVPTVDPCVVTVLVEAGAACTDRGVRLIVANARRQPWMLLTQARLPGVVRLHREAPEPLADLLDLLARQA